MNKILSLVVILVLVVAIGGIFANKSSTESVENVEVREGVQYITVNAKGGYSPRVSVAKANIPTKLVVQTNDTFDCSLALTIHSLNFRKTLSSTGTEIIDLGIQENGSVLRGVCSMGMYSFQVKFI